MSHRPTTLLLACAFLGFPITGAVAQKAGRAPTQSPQAPGAIVRQQTDRSAREFGVTQELVPDAKETATGGPSGGVPGRSGN